MDDSDELYNRVSERMWEKLEFHRNEFDLTSLNFSESFLADQIQPRSLLLQLVREVEEELHYEMSEFQCSWAVHQFAKYGVFGMMKYDAKHNKVLRPRP